MIKEKSKKIKIAYYVIGGLLVIGYLIYLMTAFYKNKDSLTLTKNYPSEYLSLLNIKDTSEIHPVINYTTKFRFPISLIDYQNKYALIIYKISDSSENISLTKQILLNKNYSYEKSSEIYLGVNENYFELFYHNNDRKMPFGQLSLNLSGDSISNLTQSDSLISYYLLFNQISWTRKPDNFMDIYIEPKDATPLAKMIPASVTFLKRNGSIYFVMLSINDHSSAIDKSLIRNLISQSQ
jgi:hypothetical protein